MELEMGLVFNNGRMDQDINTSGKMIKLMEKEF